MEELKSLVEFVKNGDDEQAIDLAKKLIKHNKPEEIISCLTEGMRELGDKFERKEVFLPELLIASDALMEVMKIVEPYLPIKKENKKTMIIGTVAGDIHEIGKNLVGVLCKAEGINVIDLGTDVAIRKFIDKAEEVSADVIGLSTLMTNTMKGQKEVVEQLIKEGKRDKFKVIIGGAPVSQRWADTIGADAYCKDAFEAAKYLRNLK